MADDVKPNQIEKLLTEVIAKKEKLEDAKAVLRHFKVKSDKLLIKWLPFCFVV